MALLLKPKPSPSPSPSHSSLLLLLRRRDLCATSASPPPPQLTQSEAKLLDALHAALLDHRRAHPTTPLPTSPPFDLALPSLSATLSSLLSKPPPPHLPLHLLRRLLLLPRDVPLPEALAFFHHLLPSLPSSSLPPLFSAMIDLAGKHHHFALARHLLDEMRARSITITTHTILSLARRYVRAGLAPDAAELFRRMPEYGVGAPDPHALASLLGALSRKRLAGEAQALFDTYKSVFPPDVVVYSALVHAWCRAGQLDEAEHVFAEMRQSGLTPNAYTYTAVIDAMYRAGQVPRAQELLCQMIDAGCRPTTATFNAIMRSHVRAGRAEQVLQVHNQMQQLGCEPDIITYNFLIETHCGKGQSNLDAALKVLARMVAKGCTPNCQSFNPMFRLVSVLGNVGAAHKLYEQMREQQCKPNTLTYNLLMKLFNKNKSMDMVLMLKNEMDAERVEPNMDTYAVLIEVFCGRGNWNRAHLTLKEMVEKGFRPTKPVYEMVLKLLRKVGQLKKHEELVEAMAQLGFISRPQEYFI